MGWFVGIVIALAALILLLRFAWFMLKLASRATHDVRNYANGRPHGYVKPPPTPSIPRYLRPKITDEDREYFRQHVPASAGTPRAPKKLP